MSLYIYVRCVHQKNNTFKESRMRNKNNNYSRSIILVLTLILSILFPTGALADYHLTQQQICEGNGINYQEATQLAKRIKIAIEKEDKRASADMIQYPLKVYTRKQLGEKVTWNGKKPIKWPIVKQNVFIIHSRQQLIKEYHKIIIPELFTNTSDSF